MVVGPSWWSGIYRAWFADHGGEPVFWGDLLVALGVAEGASSVAGAVLEEGSGTWPVTLYALPWCHVERAVFLAVPPGWYVLAMPSAVRVSGAASSQAPLVLRYWFV